MKRLTPHIIIAFILFLTGGDMLSVHAQIRSNIDKDIHSIRDCMIPGFHYEYDDYLQYIPAGLAIGMKAAGYESRSSWGRMIVSDAFSVAAMATTVNAVKYSIKRLRPDGSKRNSFPSGHTATAFMSATMLHKEYGWRSPWFSIGGYTVAAVTGVSRIMNNKHWMSDVVAGAAIGIGSVHLGYYLGDLIFKEKGLSSIYTEPSFHYDPDTKHYVAELFFGRRYIIGAEGLKEMGTLPIRGGITGLSADIPVKAGLGVTARLSASSMTYTDSSVSPMYSVLAGGYWNLHFARRFEFQTHVMAGYAWLDGPSPADGIDLAAGIGLSVMTDSNFKIKAFADFESADLSRTMPWLNTVILGWSSAWFW
jgi:hypothetical protein